MESEDESAERPARADLDAASEPRRAILCSVQLPEVNEQAFEESPGQEQLIARGERDEQTDHGRGAESIRVRSWSTVRIDAPELAVRCDGNCRDRLSIVATRWPSARAA